MSIRWKERKRPAPPEIGDNRTVRKLLLLPKKLAGEWRWLGVERVVQVRRRETRIEPEMGSFTVACWRDVRWEDTP